MLTKIDNPAAYEMRPLIRFSNANNVNPIEIHQLCDVYGEHAICSSMLRRWMRLFNQGRENMHYPWSGRPSVANEYLMRAVEEQIIKNRLFAVS
jgi:hypothetical protein